MSSEYPGKNRIIVGKNNCRSSSAKSLRSKIRGSVPRRDWKTTAMCPKQGLGSCQKYVQARRETTRLHSSHPQRSGFSQVPHQESRVRESLWLIPERVGKWSVRKTLTRLSWRPWGHQGVRRRWWRPTAWCERMKRRRYGSNNWTYSSKFCFFKKLPQCFHWGNSAMNVCIRITWKAVKDHILPKRGERNNWLQYI